MPLAGACFRTGIDIAWWGVLGRAQHCTTFPRIWVKTKETLSVLPSLNSCDDSGLHKLEGKKNRNQDSERKQTNWAHSSPNSLVSAQSFGFSFTRSRAVNEGSEGPGSHVSLLSVGPLYPEEFSSMGGESQK